jgi:hypothetical protein
MVAAILARSKEIGTKLDVSLLKENAVVWVGGFIGKEVAPKLPLGESESQRL